MKIFGTVALLMFVFAPMPLFAQNASTQGTGTTGSGLDSAPQVQNQSQQGGFIGSGRPVGFVGVDEIYNTSSTSRSSSSRGNSRVTTTSRPRTAASSTQRRQGTTTGNFQSGGTSNTQSIRSTTSLDAEMTAPSTRRPLPKVEPQLERIHGLQDGRVTFVQSLAGTTAILRGTVASERERRVAQQLLLLEPGIHRVENLLEIR